MKNDTQLMQLVAVQAMIDHSDDDHEMMAMMDDAAPLREKVIARYMPLMRQLAAAGLLHYYDASTKIGGQIESVCENGGFQLNCEDNDQPDAIVSLPWRDFAGSN